MEQEIRHLQKIYFMTCELFNDRYMYTQTCDPLWEKVAFRAKNFFELYYHANGI